MKVRANVFGVRSLGLSPTQVYTVVDVWHKNDVEDNSIVSLDPKPETLSNNSLSMYWLKEIKQRNSTLPEWW
jgi:hypothetical protein